METTRQKRVIFSEDEKATLRRAVLKRKAVIENRKSDAFSVVQKSKCWEEVKDEYNSHPNTTKRTVAQLRKLWENIKFRRKLKLEAAKRERMKTRESPYIPKIKEEFDQNSCAEDTEMTEDPIDSQTVFLTGNSYELVEDGGIPFTEEVVSCELHCSSSTKEASPDSQCSSTWLTPQDVQKNQQAQGESEESDIEEHNLSRKRRNLQLQYDREFHQLRIKEQQLKIKLVENQILHEMRLFELQKAKIHASL